MYPFRARIPDARTIASCIGIVGIIGALCFVAAADDDQASRQFNTDVGRGDWPQLGGSPSRNNARDARNPPREWNVETGKNIKWRAKLGAWTNGNIVVANGQIYIGTNNAAGCLKRYPPTRDLGVLLCFRETDGEFLWQYSAEKLVTGRVHDWPSMGIYSAPVVEGERLWFVTNRNDVVCLDAAGFGDAENDGPVISEKPDRPEVDWDQLHEADIVWSFDMRSELGVCPHQRSPCSPTIWGDVLFICTSNGVDESYIHIPAPDAPSFIALDKRTGKVLWTDNSPGQNILNAQWSSPVVGVFDGVPQVLFPGGDGWLYSFRADRWNDGKPELLWKFDGNPKDAMYLLGGRSSRNGIVAVPVIHDGLVFFAMGDEPEHGEGPGHLWCVDPTKRGDVSPDLVVDQDGKIVPHQRIQATAAIGNVRPKVIPNPNSAVVWHYDKHDQNGDGEFDFLETMHRSVGSPTIKNDLLFIADFGGVVHCLNAKTGKPHWTYETFAACWTTSLIAGKNVYVPDEDGEMAIFSLSPNRPRASRFSIRQIDMGASIYVMPIFANDVLYVATKNELFAIADEDNAP